MYATIQNHIKYRIDIYHTLVTLKPGFTREGFMRVRARSYVIVIVKYDGYRY